MNIFHLLFFRAFLAVTQKIIASDAFVWFPFIDAVYVAWSMYLDVCTYLAYPCLRMYLPFMLYYDNIVKR